METLILDLVDKTRNGYAIRYCTKDCETYGFIVIPIKIYKWYTSAQISSSNTYKIKSYDKSKYSNITITKILLSKNKYCHMKIEFDDKVLYVPEYHFNKIAKTYCFQTYVDIKVFDGNGQLMYYNYRFLKNYNTKSKAAYFTDKFAYRFASMYNKWLIKDNTHNNISSELFNGDIIYEHECIFRTKDGNGIAIYSFNIASIENG